MNMDSEDRISRPGHIPFWRPWGPLGCFWRTLVFLLGICLICFLLSLMRGCNGSSGPNGGFGGFGGFGDLPNEDNGGADRDSLLRELRDTSYVDDWGKTIPGIGVLPDRDDNLIPPVDTTNIITNPEDSITKIVSNQLIVFFNSNDVKNDMISFANQFKEVYPEDAYNIIYYNPTAGTMLLSVPNSELLSIADNLPLQIKDVDFLVTTNEVINSAASKPSDPGFKEKKYSEYFKLIQAYEAWGDTKGSKDVKVAIIDSYFDLTHPEIGERFTDRINITTKRLNVLPPSNKPVNNEFGDYCHGTHVAGIAIGAQNNKMGCSGIAPNCTWIPIALGTAPFSTFHIFEGILYAIYHGADVINLSIGGIAKEAGQIPIGDQILISKSIGKRSEKVWNYIVKAAVDHNCVICKAAGNEDALMGIDYMNRSNSVINVEAVDSKGIKANFSNFGIIKQADIHYSTVAAPGTKIWSSSDMRCEPYWDNLGMKAEDGFLELDGTSMATPFVTGAVALLKSKNKNLTAEQIRKILVMTAKQTDNTNVIGPTIQIKDALNATGGQLANFDDLMKNHDLLKGKWKSTHELMITKPDGSKLDNVWTYFIFTSPTTGRVEHHTIHLGTVYKADLTVDWQSDKFIINQKGEAVNEKGKSLTQDKFICAPDENRLLKADCYRATENGKVYDFNLEKVK